MSAVDDMPVKAGRRRYLDAASDKWRVVCPSPKEHANIIRHQNGKFYCETCKESYRYAVDKRERVLLKG